VVDIFIIIAEFERDILRERVKAGIAHARLKGTTHGRPQTVAKRKDEILKLKAEGMNNLQIAKKLKIGRTSVIRVLTE
jgi:putative DNA-invertase from lambdoid prophage Rac